MQAIWEILNLCIFITNPKLIIMKKTITVLLFAIMTMTMACSQTVDGILGKYFESIGGIEKWKALKTLKMIGVLPTPQGEFAFEMSRKTPNKYMFSLVVMEQKMIPQAFDGETAWMLNPFTGDPAPQKLPEDQAKVVRLIADFEEPFIDYAKKGHEVTYEGTEEVDGIKCYIVKLLRNKGKGDEEATLTYYFDCETYLPLMTKQKSNAVQMAGQEVNLYYSDYQDAGDGLFMPFMIDTKVGGKSVQVFKYKSIEINKEIADDVFKFPGVTTPEVK